jgi:hypothetical protein
MLIAALLISILSILVSTYSVLLTAKNNGDLDSLPRSMVIFIRKFI